MRSRSTVRSSLAVIALAAGLSVFATAPALATPPAHAISAHKVCKHPAGRTYKCQHKGRAVYWYKGRWH